MAKTQRRKKINNGYTKEDLVSDYERVKRLLDKDRLGVKEYLRHSNYHFSAFTKKYETWNNFKNEIGERPLVHHKVSKEELDEKARELFNKNGKLTAEIMRRDGYAQSVVDRIYGSFGKMMKSLNLKQEAIGRTRELTDKEFLSDLVKISSHYGYANPTLLAKHSKTPLASFINRFGTFGNACLVANVYHVGEKSKWNDEGEAMMVFKQVSNLISEPKFHTEMTFDWLRNDETGFPLPVDAFFPQSNLVVEYHGPVHYDENFWLNQMNTSKGIDEYKRLDSLKERLCEENGVNIITIYDYEKDDVENIVSKNINCR